MLEMAYRVLLEQLVEIKTHADFEIIPIRVLEAKGGARCGLHLAIDASVGAAPGTGGQNRGGDPHCGGNTSTRAEVCARYRTNG